MSIVNLGLLADLDRISLWGFSLSKLITYILLGGGVGVILSEIALGSRSAKDFLKDTQKFAEETIGMDARQFERTLKKGAQKLGMPQSITDRLLAVNAATGQVDYPSPAELQSRLRADFRAHVFAASVDLASPSTVVQSTLAILPVAGTAATSEGLEKVSDYLKARVRTAIIFLVVIGAIFAMTYLVKWFW